MVDRLALPARALLDALLPMACAACAAPASAPFCPRCQETIAPAPPSVLAAAMFGGALADAVRAAKFRPDVVVAEQLGAWWAERIAARSCPAIDEALARGVDGVAFVPAPWRRRVQRRFDLPAVLAQALGRAIGRPVVDALACTRTDAPLSHGADKAARAVIVQGRYRVRAAFARALTRSQQRLIIVDDVRTTGATLAEAQRALEQAGALVECAALAIAP